MDQITFDFVADNPGDWLFHGHHLYHLEGLDPASRYSCWETPTASAESVASCSRTSTRLAAASAS